MKEKADTSSDFEGIEVVVIFLTVSIYKICFDASSGKKTVGKVCPFWSIPQKILPTKLVLVLNHNLYCIFCLHNEHIQSYSLGITPTGCNGKDAWYKTCNNHDILAKRLHPSVLFIGASILARLSRYQKPA